MILRTTFKDGQVLLEDLGDQFTLTSKQRSPQKFETIMRDNQWQSPDCYAVISVMRTGRADVPIYPDYHYSIIGERGNEVMPIHIGSL